MLDEQARLQKPNKEKTRKNHCAHNANATAGQDALDSIVSPDKRKALKALGALWPRGRQSHSKFLCDFRDRLPSIDHESQMQRLLEYQVASMGDENSKDDQSQERGAPDSGPDGFGALNERGKIQTAMAGSLGPWFKLRAPMDRVERSDQTYHLPAFERDCPCMERPSR